MTESRHSLNELSPEKLSRLIARLKQKRSEDHLGRTIPRANESHIAPLSFAQQRLWFLDQFEPNTSLYNIYAGFRLSGGLRVEALAQGFNEIVRRHEILRTRFSSVEGQPMQVISPALLMKVAEVDLDAFPPGAQERVAKRLAGLETHRPFDLAQGPLIRISILRLSTERILLLTLHHIIFDGWSNGPLIRELVSCYREFSQGLPATLADLPIQYADYVLWQRGWLQGEVLESQLSYWRRQLADASVILELPTDRSRPAVQTHNGSLETIVLPKSLIEAINGYSSEAGATLFMALLGAFQALLGRYTGQEDILVGSPVANRNHPEIEGLIGLFLNTLVLRSDLSGNPSFSEFLSRVRKAALDAYAHQDVPFELLVEILQPERVLSHTPLFQVMFTLENGPRDSLQFEKMSLSPWALETHTAKVDLLLVLRKFEEGMIATIQYNTDLFDSTTIRRMLSGFERILEGVVDDPHQLVANLPLLSEAEFFQLVCEFNDTQRPYPLHLTVDQLFHARAAHAPDAVALVYEDLSLTYGELERRANQLAYHLLGLDLGPESLVGVALYRSPEMIIGLLAILKAGAAYLPIDFQQPPRRLARIIEGADPAIVLTQQSWRDTLSEHAVPLLCLDTEWPLITGNPESAPAPRVAIDQLAYVCYTSGSTGRPKGVAVSHRGVLRLVCGVDYVHLDSSEILLQAAPLAFDASTFEIWGALLHGGRLVLYPDLSPTPVGLRQSLHTAQVTTLWLTASLFNLVVDQDVTALNHVKQLLAGGEALSPRHVEQARRQLPQTALINGYGPTEGTTFTCCGAVGNGQIRLGRPIANTQVYVIDSRAGLAPGGARGELWIGGDGLARGYHQDAWQTAEKFVPDGVSGSYGARVYRSGDLVRQVWSGEVEYLGRVDNQVKVRGYRVELEEVESELRQLEGVRGAVARVEVDQRGEKTLVGYVVWEEGVRREWSEVRQEMLQRVPEYMTPGIWVELAELPLNANGKVDHKRLRGAFGERAVRGTEYEGPRTPEEEALVGIWKKSLGLDRVGVHDNFFALGGHSLLATQLMIQVCREFQVDLPLRSLFEAPTIAEMAQQIANINGSQEETRRKAAQIFQFVKGLTESEVHTLLREKKVSRR